MYRNVLILQAPSYQSTVLYDPRRLVLFDACECGVGVCHEFECEGAPKGEENAASQ